MAITIRDVAKAAGVSVATVSLVLNEAAERLRIAKETQERVRACATKLGYVPDRRAQSLRQASQVPSTVLVALIAERMPNAYVVDIMQGIDQAAAQVGWETQFHLVRAGDATGWETLRSVARTCMGVVLVGHVDAPDRKLMQRLPVPAVHLGAGEVEGALEVRVDNWLGGKQVAEHLLSLGHRTIAILGPRRWTIPFVERRDGIETTLVAAGAPPPLVLSQSDPVEATVEQLQGASVTASVCVYDRLALGLLRAARLAGANVPQDMSIASFDDMDYSALLSPPLTTVHIPRLEMAITAFGRLRALVDGTLHEEAPLIVTPRLVVRESTGPPLSTRNRQ